MSAVDNLLAGAPTAPWRITITGLPGPGLTVETGHVMRVRCSTAPVSNDTALRSGDVRLDGITTVDCVRSAARKRARRLPVITAPRYDFSYIPLQRSTASSTINSSSSVTRSFASPRTAEASSKKSSI